MSIAAVVDGYGGKPIDLVQHTPKRDKGPQGRPDRIPLSARLPSSVSMYGTASGDNGMGFGSQAPYEQRMNQNPSLPPTEALFERIQFKQATANNGKRRAAQQYYHLLVELFADGGPGMGETSRWLKVAYRMSEQMVVRGRSPGHYQSERRGSNASSGPGQGGSSTPYNPASGASRGLGDPMSISGGSSMLSGGGYPNSYDTRSHHYTTAHGIPLELPVEPIMSSEEAKAIDEIEGYQYYPSVLNEGHMADGRAHGFSIMSPYRDDRGGHPPQLPGVGDYTQGEVEPRIKQEYPSGPSLPSLTGGPLDSIGRRCGRFEGTPTSRGYYPMIFQHSEVDTT